MRVTAEIIKESSGSNTVLFSKSRSAVVRHHVGGQDVWFMDVAAGLGFGDTGSGVFGSSEELFAYAQDWTPLTSVISAREAIGALYADAQTVADGFRGNDVHIDAFLYTQGVADGFARVIDLFDDYLYGPIATEGE